MTLDGKIATDKGHSAWVTSPAARAHVFRTRANSDVVIVGGNTVSWWLAEEWVGGAWLMSLRLADGWVVLGGGVACAGVRACELWVRMRLTL